MKHSLIIVYAAVAILLVLAFFLGGLGLIEKALQLSFNTAANTALMLVASFLVIGQLNKLITTDVLEKWLQKFKGIKAIIVSALAGGLFPGGPYIYYPFISSFGDRQLPLYLFISFIYGKQIYDFSRLPMEISLVDPKVALIRVLITLPIPILMGLLAKKIFGPNRTLEPMAKGGKSK